MKRFAISIGCALITTLPIASAIGKDQSPEDQTFVNEASRGGIMEVKSGELAERNGLSSEVKEFGAHMVKDHTRLNKELGAAATSIGLTVPTDLSEDQKTEYTKLSNVRKEFRQGVYRPNGEGPHQRSCRFSEGRINNSGSKT
jgi:putative membrane protein